MTSTVIEERLPVKSKIAYALANGANGLLSGLGLGQIVYFYTKRLGMDPALQGLAWLIFAAWNAVNDPLIGILQEKTKSKLGRRVPFLRYGAPIYAVLFVLVWFPFAAPGDSVMLFVNLLLVLFLFDTVYSMIGLVTYSLPAEMAITAKERGSIVVYSTMIGFLTQVAGIALPIMFLLGDSFDMGQWQVLMIVMAVACGLLLYGSSFFIKENRWAQKEPTLGFKDSIVETFKNKQFLILEISVFSLLIVQTVLMSGILFLFDYTYGGLVVVYLIPVLISILAAVFIFNMLIPRIGIKKIFMYGLIIGAVGFGTLPLFGRSLAVAFIPMCAVAVGFAAIIMGQQPLMADVIDYDELLTGKRRETTYSGVNALITKPAISVANALFLGMLGFFGYIECDGCTQPATVGDGVLLAFAIIPTICATISIIALHFFKLDGPEWLAKKKILQEVHQQKERDYVESLRKDGKI